MDELIIVISTFPDMQQARQIGTVLIERQLAACVNLIPGVESIYRWGGVIENSSEVLAIFKTRGSLAVALEREIEILHPYDLPEIIRVSPHSASPAYARWVMGQTQSQ